MCDYDDKEAKVIDLTTVNDTRTWIVNYLSNLKSDTPKPVMIRTNFYSVFDFMEKKAQSGELCRDDHKDKAEKNIKKTRDVLESRVLNFLLNSSIWLRFCNDGPWDGQTGSVKTDAIDIAIKEFGWFKGLGLYGFPAAKEYIDYQVRVQNNNQLKETEGHGTYITPTIYSNEVEYRDFFLKKDDSKIRFKFLRNDAEASNHDFQTEDVALRILMVDDKIGEPQEAQNSGSDNDKNGPRILKCDKCERCNYPKPKSRNNDLNICKLRVVSKLMSGNFIDNDDDRQGNLRERTYWADKVNTYVVRGLTTGEVWRLEEGQLKLKTDEGSFFDKYNNKIKGDSGCVQVIAVPDIESALTLMSCCKFDIILLDYLLGERGKNNPERTYSTELFEFMSLDFKKTDDAKGTTPVVKMLKMGLSGDEKQKTKFLKEFHKEVILNRGPLDKYWIVPMTSYNSSFISDLQRKNVQLIGHRWNISQGADPVNTPWHFLHKINEFVDLQLRSSVFRLYTLLLFLKYMCEDSIQLKPKDGEDTIGFYDFQAFMGAEYANFMRRYGNRQMLRRDAALDGDTNADKSLFATYIWMHFYVNPEYRDVIELNRLIRRFLHHASVMHNDGNGQQMLEDTFGQLSFFIDTNKKVQDTIGNFEDLKGLDKKMMSLRKIIDCLTDHRGNKKDNKKKTK